MGAILSSIDRHAGNVVLRVAQVNLQDAAKCTGTILNNIIIGLDRIRAARQKNANADTHRKSGSYGGAPEEGHKVNRSCRSLLLA